jgi:hypothetical protein
MRDAGIVCGRDRGGSFRFGAGRCEVTSDSSARGSRRRFHEERLVRDLPFLKAAQDAGCRTANGDQMVEAVQEIMLDFMLHPDA